MHAWRLESGEPTPMCFNHFNTTLEIKPILKHLKLLFYINRFGFKYIIKGGKTQKIVLLSNYQTIIISSRHSYIFVKKTLIDIGWSQNISFDV